LSKSASGVASFEASGCDFRYYPERRHSLALHQVTQRTTALQQQGANQAGT
jgi:hypothetical protein